MRLEFRHRLQEFFPPSDARSPWMLRLAILRDDLSYDLQQLPLAENDGPEEVWRCNYALRRLSVVLIEVRNIFAREVSAFAKRPVDEVAARLAGVFVEARRKLEAAIPVLEPIRNSLGAHVRPENGASDPQVTARILTEHPQLGGSIVIDLDAPKATSFRDLTLNSLAFAWPGADTDEAIDACHELLYQTLLSAVPPTLQAIDSLLIHFWLTLGLLAPDDEHTWALRDGEEDWIRVVPAGGSSRD